MTLSSRKNIHFIGMGGIGMSAIAHVLLEMGHNVSGSDVESGDITRKLESMGARFYRGHKADNLRKETDIVVYSSSISKDNPELEKAAQNNLRTMHRAEMLGEIFNRKKGIAVCGTHGKTTTTSLIAVLLKKSGLDPTVMIGGEVSAFAGNARLGKGDYIVAEADESDSSFLHLRPLRAVITNIEMEHPDHFRTMTHMRRSYRSFIGNLKKGGKVFYNYTDKNARTIIKSFRGRSESFGFSRDADMYADDIVMDGFRTEFTCFYRRRKLGNVHLKIPGRHNILNAMAAIMVALDLGLSFKEAVLAIKDFDGAKRRFQLRADRDGVMLIDDYAHHPTEIRAVLDACGNWKDRRLVVVFQPHRYSRTKFFAEEFGRCFKGVDKLILTDIYAASEKAIEGVSIRDIYERVKGNGIGDTVVLKKGDIVGYIMKCKRPGDIVLVMGAGDIKDVANDLAHAIEGRSVIRDFTDAALIADLRKSVKGAIKIGEQLRLHTSFRIGGPADIWIEPAGIPALRKTLAFAAKNNVPRFILGNGSNLLPSDEGFRGMVIRLADESFKRLKISGSRVRVGSGFSLPKLVNTCCAKGLSGMESLVGIPGTIGGAVYMNAGGHTSPMYKNIGSMVQSVKVMDYAGRVKVLRASDIEFGYRASSLEPYILLEVVLKLHKGNSSDLTASCVRFLKMKKDKQVLDMPNAGCIFKNPKDYHFTCGQLIDMLRLKGKRIGGAEISRKHANFIINRGDATAKDVIDLINFIRRKVGSNYEIDLELEVKQI